MNYDEFGFFNRQLAAMLKDGIPLEGAIKQLCADMRAGRLRRELELLEQNLAKGVPLKEAMAGRAFPRRSSSATSTRRSRRASPSCTGTSAAAENRSITESPGPR